LKAAREAAAKIAPLWPLKHFVAVNPFVGLGDKSLPDVAVLMANVAGARVTMPRSFYAEAIARGDITDADLDAALGTLRGRPGVPPTVNVLRAVLLEESEDPPADPLPSVADLASDIAGKSWQRFVVERISAWAAAYFDEGQSLWPMPWRHLPPYEAWRAQAVLDRAPELAGLPGFRKAVSALPETAHDLVALGAERLGLSGEALENYFHRLLMDIGGWASFARYQVWQSELRHRQDETMVGLLAVRLAWELALLQILSDREVEGFWALARHRYGEAWHSGRRARSLTIDCLLHVAYERSRQRDLIERFGAGSAPAAPERAAVQAAFCIDVRSEVIRRSLEALSPQIETIGFAGFFGLPIDYVPLGHRHGDAHCPVLLAPAVTIREAVRGLDDTETDALRQTRIMRQGAAGAWKSFKLAAVSSFGFVESLGLSYLGKLVTDSLGLTRPVPHPERAGLPRGHRHRAYPGIEPASFHGSTVGLSAQQRLDMAERILTAMSLKGNFARLVLFAGHGSTTVNNPHATGLDCGACGGHTGEVSARVAVAILNDPFVRSGLSDRGIPIPADTVFLAGLHDTTTDRITLFDEADVPRSHAPDLARLRAWLEQAGSIARAERARLLGIDPAGIVERSIARRSNDWSQVRPEWGLAGCASFVAAPRARTADLDLGGRAFLHNYDWKQDEGFAILELIMTAPMVVASWISLQYYGSSVDNRRFGAGNKVLHNVVGTVGVLEGNGGDLRAGLPWQSVHDGGKLVHEPVRLNVVIEAPIAAINRIIAAHDGVRALVDNGWLSLLALGESGRIEARYAGGGVWESVDEEEPCIATAC
jgi:hypothetical protein